MTESNTTDYDGRPAATAAGGAFKKPAIAVVQSSTTGDARQWFASLSPTAMVDIISCKDERVFHLIAHTTTTTNHRQQRQDDNGGSNACASTTSASAATATATTTSGKAINGRRTNENNNNDGNNWWDMNVKMTVLEHILGDDDQKSTTTTTTTAGIEATIESSSSPSSSKVNGAENDQTLATTTMNKSTAASSNGGLSTGSNSNSNQNNSSDGKDEGFTTALDNNNNTFSPSGGSVAADDGNAGADSAGNKIRRNNDDDQDQHPDAYRIRNEGGGKRDDEGLSAKKVQGTDSSTAAATAATATTSTDVDRDDKPRAASVSATTTTNTNTTTKITTGSDGGAVNPDATPALAQEDEGSGTDSKDGTGTGLSSGNLTTDDDTGKKETVIATKNSKTDGPNSNAGSSSSPTSVARPTIQSFMENICFVLPAALDDNNTTTTASAKIGQRTTSEAATTITAQETVPTDNENGKEATEFVLSLNPSYVKSVSSHELISGLDEILSSGENDKSEVIQSDDTNRDDSTTRSVFLSSSGLSSQPAFGTFWEYMKNYYASKDMGISTSTPNSVPLYMLLILHFQYSAYRTYYSSDIDKGFGVGSSTSSNKIGLDTNGQTVSQSDRQDHSHSILSLERVVKKLLESDEDIGFNKEVSVFLLSLIDDECQDNATSREMKADDGPPLGTDGPTTPPLSPSSASKIQNVDVGVSNTSNDPPKKEESAGIEGVGAPDSEENESGSPTSKSKSGRKNSRGGGKKKRKRNKKKKSVSNAVQDESKPNTVQGEKEEKTNAAPTEESKPKDAQDEAAIDHVAGRDDENTADKKSNDDTTDEKPNGKSSDVESKMIKSSDDKKATGREPKDGSQMGVSKTESTVTEKKTEASTPAKIDAPNLNGKSVSIPGLGFGRDRGTMETIISSDSSTDSSKQETQDTVHDDSDDDEKPEEGPLAESASHEKGAGGETTPDQSMQADDGEWETVVGARSRNSRKKKSNNDRNFSSGGRSGSQYSNGQASLGEQGSNSRKKKEREGRKRTQNRKSGKESLSTELDSVDEGSKSAEKSRVAGTPVSALGKDRSGPSIATKIQPNVSSGAIARQSIPSRASAETAGTTMRDILLGKKKETPARVPDGTNPPRAKPMSYSDRARATAAERAPLKKSEPGTKTTSAADQNTIPTVPETLSAVSATSAYTPSISNVTPRGRGVTRTADSESEGSEVAQKPPDSPPQPPKGTSPSPPLPTLLNPGNNNSSSSSVASSLEAPHTREHGNKSHPSEDDVGFHLLGVCRRLSNDVTVFMKRREEALAVRRRERELVLRALEDSLGTLWPGLCSVEMYGSCATNLDLPSSDLDVVVRGLDRPRAHAAEPHPSPSKSETSNPETDAARAEDSSSKKTEGMPRVNSQPAFSHYGPDSLQYSPRQHHVPGHHGQMMYGQMSLNAERVVRLSMELERQPWAVHVKAIPTATVPVIKILADPARVPGAPSDGGKGWFLQHAPVAGQSPKTGSGESTTPADAKKMAKQESQSRNQTAIAHYASGGEAPPLWRGADVTNGLLNLDITFEGPEHGGIGSTKFSQRVVGEFAAKSGLSPEETPEVQALMVLKELLAQRRLNEPFSGGLSSYALLLLVVSVLKEREIIREELDKVERQRRDVASGGGNSALQSSDRPQQESWDSTSGKPSSQSTQKKKESGQQPRSEKTPSVVGQPKDGREVANGNTRQSQKGAETSVAAKAVNNTDPAKKNDTAAGVPPKAPPSSSWASIAKQTNGNQKAVPAMAPPPPAASIAAAAAAAPASAPQPLRRVLKKPSSFADAVAKGMPQAPVLPTVGNAPRNAETTENVTEVDNTALVGRKTSDGKKKTADATKGSSSNASPAPIVPNLQPRSTSTPQEEPRINQTKQVDNARSSSSVSTLQERVMEIVTEGKKINAGTAKDISDKEGKSPSADNTSVAVLSNPDESHFPQGFHDVIEVLCSGETTPGKLLMHFLLFYGQHFDSHSTAIDYSGTHSRDLSANLGYSLRSSYMRRNTAGSYDPVTGMLTVDPIVVYDPLEGAESNNVARSCFLWSNVRWVFTQSYMTLSSAAETNQGGGSNTVENPGNGVNDSDSIRNVAGRGPTYGHDKSGNVVVDPNSPLLELLLSF